ncbi:MAG: ABC transporter substrate-binding protein [Actinomycetota bacterium]
MDDSLPASGAAAPGSVTDPAAPATATGDATDGDAEDSQGETASFAALERQWAEARAEVVEAIEFGGYGVDEDNVLRGPAGLEIDLDDCPSEWADDAGLDRGAIRIAHTAPLSGNLFAYGHLGSGMGVYFDWVNANGGVDGRDLELTVLDDGYDREQTATLLDELIEEEPPFLVTTLGSPTSLEVYDDLNDECIPHPFVMSSHPAFGDPDGHPWTTGLQLSQTTEALIWGNWIKQDMRGELPVRVAALVIDNEFGVVYEDAFAAWAEANSDVVSEFIPVRHDPQTAGLEEEIAEVVDAEPEVFIAMTTGDPCLLAVQYAGSSGLNEQAMALFTSSTCQQPARYLAPAGNDADGFLVANGGGKSTVDPRYADEPFIAFANQQLAAAGLDTTIGFYGTGFAYYGWAHVEALRIAAELNGGLTRSNLMLAIRSLDLIHPMFLDGIPFSFDGADDGFAIEGSEISRFDAATQTWRPIGPVIDLNGLSPSCSWSGQRC